MNKIIFAGKSSEIPPSRTGNCFTIAIPSEHTEGGSVFWESGGCRYEHEFPKSNVIAVPPAVSFRLDLRPAEDCLCVLLERALLPFKEITVIRDDDARGILHAARQAEAYLSSPFKGKTDLVLSALGGLIVSYLTAFAANDGFSPVTKQLIADIEKNISNSTYFLDGFIKSMPLNYDYVRKLFKKETGATPHDFLMSRRMELAATLLKSGISNRYSAYSVSQIAEACGFADPLYFSKVFKKHYGASPAVYGKT